MRVIKSNTLKYESFHKSLPSVFKNGRTKDDSTSSVMDSFGYEKKEFSSEHLLHLFHTLLTFQKSLKVSTDVQSISYSFNDTLKRIFEIKEAVIYFFDDSNLSLIPLDLAASQSSTAFLNNSFKEGILDWIFDSGDIKTVPDLNSFNAHGSNLNYVLIPIIEDKKNKGVLLILTNSSKFTKDSLEMQFIQMCLNLAVSRIDVLKKKEEINSTYHELQLYQSKLANDFRLAAIGELTVGVVEDILSPLQVIMSYTDYIEKDEDRVDPEILDTLKSQVKKVETVINRLLKFSSINDGKFKIYPCNINELIKDYYNVILSSLENSNYECILDFEENIPSVLSNPNFINQLFTNIFSMIKSAENSNNGGGILIQTKYIKENIVIRIIATDFIKSLSKDSVKEIKDLNLRILNNLMEKHEGNVQIDSDESTGTTIVLTFPLKRKIRA